MLLTVEGLTKKFGGRTVLDSVSFSLDAGGRLGIVGRSGCGKSTLVKLITRVLNAECLCLMEK